MNKQFENSFKYHAFISYRHADNKSDGRHWASWLHQALETYEIPEDLVGKKNTRGDIIPERIFPIFRDEDELPADADLGGAITRALDQTNFLIVLCSPRAVQSKYVAEEVDYFKSLGRSDRVMAAIIDGEPNASWDEGKCKLGYGREDECFPEPIQFQYVENQRTEIRAEPIAADFRFVHDGRSHQGWTNAAYYKEFLKKKGVANTEINQVVNNYEQQLKLMVLKVVAGIIGVSLGELTQRDKAYRLLQEQQKARKLRKWLAAITVMALVAIATGIYAIGKKEEAERLVVEANNNLGLAYLESAKIAWQEKRHFDASYLATESLLALNYEQSPSETSYAKGLIAQSKMYGGLTEPLLSGKAKDGSILPTAHDDIVRQIAFSPDGKVVASASDDNTVKVWSVSTGEHIATLVGHTASVGSLAFSPNGKMIASASGDKSIKLWDLVSFKEIKTLKGHTESVLSVDFSPDGETLVSSGFDFTGKLWDLNSDTVIDSWDYGMFAHEISFSPDGKFIYSSNVEGLNFRSVEGQEFVDSVVGLESGLASNVVFTPDGKLFAAASNKAIKFYDVRTGEVVTTLERSHTGSIESIAISPSGELLVSASSDMTIKLWNLESNKLITTFKGHSDGVRSIDFSPINDLIVSGSDDGSVKFWEAGQGIEVTQLTGHTEEVESLLFSHEGDLLITASRDKQVKFWYTGISKGAAIGTLLDDWSFKESVSAMAVTSDSDTLAIAVDSTIELFDFNDTNNTKLFGGSDERIHSLSFDTKNEVLISISDDDLVKFWRVEDGELIGSIELDDHVFSATLTPDGQTLITTLENKVKLWNFQSRLLESTIEGHQSTIYDVKVSPDGRLLATASYDKTVKLWNIDNGELITTLKGHADAVKSVSFLWDGKVIASTSNDGTVKLWDVNSKTVITTFEQNIQQSNSMFFSPSVSYSHEKKLLAITTDESTVKIIDVSYLSDYFKISPNSIENEFSALKLRGIQLKGFNVEFVK